MSKRGWVRGIKKHLYKNYVFLYKAFKNELQRKDGWYVGERFSAAHAYTNSWSSTYYTLSWNRWNRNYTKINGIRILTLFITSPKQSFLHHKRGLFSKQDRAFGKAKAPFLLMDIPLKKSPCSQASDHTESELFDLSMMKCYFTTIFFPRIM